MCECIDEIKKRLAIEKGTDVVGFEHSGSQRSELYYKPFTRDGKLSKRFYYTSVRWKFCPFCGVRL